MNILKKTIVVLLLIYCSPILGDTPTKIADLRCRFLTSGSYTPFNIKDVKNYKNIFYRVSFKLNEIYYSIVVEKIDNGDEGTYEELLNIKRFNSDDIKDLIKREFRGEYITDLNFITWMSWNSFVIDIQGQKYILKIEEKENELKLVLL